MRRAVGALVGIDPAQLMVVELWKCKVYQRFKDGKELGKPGAKFLFVYHIPELAAKAGEGKTNPYHFITLQTHFMTDKTHFKVFGYPLIIPVEAAKVNAYPQGELRKLLRDSIEPFLVGRKWKDGEDDCETYLLDLMDGQARTCYNEIQLTHEDEKAIDLHEKINYMRDDGDFAIGLFFKLGKKDRYELDQGLEPPAPQSKKTGGQE